MTVAEHGQGAARCAGNPRVRGDTQTAQGIEPLKREIPGNHILYPEVTKILGCLHPSADHFLEIRIANKPVVVLGLIEEEKIRG